MARSNRIVSPTVDQTTMSSEIKLSRRCEIAAGALELDEVHARVHSLEALFRLPYMSLQFPGFVVGLFPARCALE